MEFASCGTLGRREATIRGWAQQHFGEAAADALLAGRTTAPDLVLGLFDGGSGIGSSLIQHGSGISDGGSYAADHGGEGEVGMKHDEAATAAAAAMQSLMPDHAQLDSGPAGVGSGIGTAPPQLEVGAGFIMLCVVRAVKCSAKSASISQTDIQGFC